ncbi:NYN domain-containing protein [Egicoccus halophilus]|nr:NYN domain-containing protein [Egicoccus halophilus]
MGIRFVDAMNVVGSRPDGWWQDRPAAVRRLADRLRTLAAAAAVDVEVVLVVDGTASEALPEGRHGLLEVRYAGHGGRNAADDLIVALVAAADDIELEVVTADRELADRVRRLGATVTGPRQLWDELDRPGRHRSR